MNSKIGIALSVVVLVGAFICATSIIQQKANALDPCGNAFHPGFCPYVPGISWSGSNGDEGTETVGATQQHSAPEGFLGATQQHSAPEGFVDNHIHNP